VERLEHLSVRASNDLSVQELQLFAAHLSAATLSVHDTLEGTD